MKFSQFTEYLEKLEKTSKRLEMFEILSEMFKKVDKNEVKPIVYFTQEQLLPPFYGLEIGMAESMIKKALMKISKESEKDLQALYKKIGDMGLVAEQTNQNNPSKGLTIGEIYDCLYNTVKISGEGSVEKKTDHIAELLKKCDSKESKYVVRFILGRLRLGIGDPTIMDSMSKAISGDRMALRKDIEKAYNLCSDLGWVGEELFKKGIDGLRSFKAKVGNPIRMAAAERLPSAKEIIGKMGKCAVEKKYDGLRLQCSKDCDKVEIFSRNLERMTPMFPDIVEGIKKQINANTAILEGEAVAYNEETGELFPFQVTITRKRKYDIEEKAKEKPLVLFAFDLLYIDGKDITREAYEDRRKKLVSIIKKGFTIRESERIVTDSPKELDEYFEESIALGSEGIMAKRLDAPYEAGMRNFNWIKLKRSYKGELNDTIDIVPIGYFKGRGMRAKFGIGALLAAVYDEKTDSFKSIAKIGSGLTEDQWVEIRKLLDKNKVEKKPARVDTEIVPDVWTTPKYIFTVMADEITLSPMHNAGKVGEKPGFALRFPRIQGWIRKDKKPEDATTVKEISQMFKMQKRVKAVSFGR
ncbi:MAG: ATP-dependent DNA ligase [Nanoarchaeota archaeon]|nr:ATP-dependent DNA ligase [Nanoarchaeota archaeon]